MPGLSVDFGLFIAYLIPGFFALLGLSLVVPPLAGLIDRVDQGEKRAGAIFALTAASVLAGLLVSVVRAGTIDWSFTIAYPWGDHSAKPQYGSIDREDPSYAMLTVAGKREAYLLAERNEKRPYQFYGNSLISLLILSGGWLASKRPWRKRKSLPRALPQLLAACLWLLLLGSLYAASRVSHYRFMRAVCVLNRSVGPA